MGIVYLARDDAIGRNVAVKALFIDPAFSEEEKREVAERFFREARAAGKLSHPNVVIIHDVGEENRTPYIAMEYLPGATLREITREGPLPVWQAEHIICQVLSVLSYAHAMGVIHRDIKPDNVFLLPDGRVKVVDFGIAHIPSSSTLTSLGRVIGTPGYMSPEQVKGEPVGPESDIFSCGVLLYELLTGSPPFSSTSATSIMYKTVHDEIPPVRQLNPGIPEYLDGIIAKACAKDPAQRYKTAREMIEDIENRRNPAPSGTPIEQTGTILRAESPPVSASLPAAAPKVPRARERTHLAGLFAGALALITAVVLAVLLLSGKGVSLQIISPGEGESVSGRAVPVSVNVTNPDRLGKMEFYLDNEKIKDPYKLTI